MHGRVLATIAALTLALTAGTAAADKGTPSPDVPDRATDHPGLQEAVRDEVNRVRTRHRLPFLRFHVALASAARTQSRYLATRARLQHESHDGEPFWTRLVAAGYPRARMMGENLALLPNCRGAVHRQARLVVRLWMESPPHREVLLQARFRSVGVSTVSSSGCESPTVYTADFGA